MTKQDAWKIVFTLKSTYPQTYQRFSEDDFRNMVSVWADIFADYPFPAVMAGLKTFISTDTNGFPPAPGQVMDAMHKAAGNQPEGATQAWAKVRKAISRGIYYSEEEFMKLPEMCQKVLGNPARLREMAMLGSDVIESVEQSHFIRQYNTEIKRSEYEAKIPADVKRLMAGMNSETFGISEQFGKSQKALTEMEQ